VKCFFFSLLFIFIAGFAIAQQADFNFINFSSKDGLSSNVVNVILKDRFGYMWFGTDDGLNKFDGVNFTVYRHHAADTTSIGANTIFAIHEDAAGNLWVGTQTTLSLYNRKKNAFINYNFPVKSIVRSLCSDHLGNLWIATFDGLHKLDPRTGKMVAYKSDPRKKGQLASNTIISVFEDSYQRLWVGTTAGLHLFLSSSNSFQRFQHVNGDSSSVSDNVVKAITEDNNGNVWFGTMDGGVNKLQPDGKSFISYKHSNTNDNTISSNRIYDMACDNNGRLLLATEDGLDMFDVQTGRVIRIVNDGRNTYSLSVKSVKSLFIDKNGIYWVGTVRGGVSKYDKNLAFFNLRQSNSFDPSGLSNPTVTSFVEDDNGDVYIGTDGGGLNLYHRKTGLFSHIRLTNGTEKTPLPVLTMERVGNELWIGTFLRGLYTLSMKTGAVKHYIKGDGPQDLTSNEIFCIRKDKQGNVWVGTNGGGVNIYNSKTGVFHRFNKDSSYGEAGMVLVNGYIRSIEEDKSGNVWIGSVGSGIVVHHTSGTAFRLFNQQNNNLPNDDIQTIYIGANDTVWVGTHGGGLSRLDNSTNKFVSYAEPEGIANAVIYKILQDGAGKIWVSTNKGISSFDPATQRFKNYTSDNGVQRSTFVLGAGLKTSRGDLFFGGLDGFNYFNPSTFKCNRNIPGIVLTDLKVSNASVIPAENAAIKTHISVAGEVRLDYKQNFSIDFVALNYSAPHESRYFYMLEGFDKSWNPTGTTGTAVFSNLNPGTYTFHVKAMSDDGSWTTPVTSIKIFIRPPFYLTPFAFIVYILVAGLILWGLRYRGISKLKNKFALEQERLQAKQMIEQKNREAEQLHQFEQAKIKYLTNLSHEFRTPVSLIVGPVERLLQQESSYEKKGQLSLIKRNAKRLLNLVNQVLDFRRLEEQETTLNMAEGDIISFVNEVVSSFKDISERKHINFTFTSALSRYYTAFDGDKIERILFNLLSNAFKFTPKGGDIWLKIDHEAHAGLQFIIGDTGIGIEPQAAEKIFNRFFQAGAEPGMLNQGSGIGLSITKEFVKLHGGAISVESMPGRGSVFTVQLPLAEIPEPATLIESSILPAEVCAADCLAKPLQEVPRSEMLTLLLVEDNEDFRYYLKDNLRHYYKIIEASDGQEGWQRVLSAHPQVIVSDISMPYMDGIELCRKIKSDKRTSHIPVILLTALTGDADQLKGLETGANDYLTKPFNFDILNVRIKNLFDLNQSLKNTYSRQLKIITPDIEFESEDEKLMLAVSQYIEDNLNSTKLSVEDLSRHVCMSRGSLYNKIVTLTGETPVEFIRSVKLNKAAALLENSDMKIAQIGYAVGFTSPNYFARAFKAKFNVLPSEYSAVKKVPSV